MQLPGKRIKVGPKNKDAGGGKRLQRRGVGGTRIINRAHHIIQETKEFQGGGSGQLEK